MLITIVDINRRDDVNMTVLDELQVGNLGAGDLKMSSWLQYHPEFELDDIVISQWTINIYVHRCTVHSGSYLP